MSYRKYEGVDYNVEVVRAMGEEQFISHNMHNHHYLHIKDPSKRTALLKQAFAWVCEYGPGTGGEMPPAPSVSLNTEADGGRNGSGDAEEVRDTDL